jgi:hypothetical protein
MRDDWHEETTGPLYADTYGLYKVEQWDVGGRALLPVEQLWCGTNVRPHSACFNLRAAATSAFEIDFTSSLVDPAMRESVPASP